MPAGVDTLPLSTLPRIISELYESKHQNLRSIIAYKGGHINKDLSADLNIPVLDLQNFGCPKAEKLMGDMIWLEACRKHLTTNAYQHCLKVEVEAYGLWLQKQI